MYKDALVISVIAAIINLIVINGEVYMMLPFISRATGLTQTQILMIMTFFTAFVSVIISKYLPFV
jgi:hypothetical protein